MFRKALFAVVVLGLSFVFVSAETIKGRITKIDEKGVTVATVKDEKKEEKTYSVAKDCKFFQITKKDDKEEKGPVEGGLKASVFQKIGEKGIGATITTNDKNEVTEIVLNAKKKKKDS